MFQLLLARVIENTLIIFPLEAKISRKVLGGWWILKLGYQVNKGGIILIPIWTKFQGRRKALWENFRKGFQLSKKNLGRILEFQAKKVQEFNFFSIFNRVLGLDLQKPFGFSGKFQVEAQGFYQDLLFQENLRIRGLINSSSILFGKPSFFKLTFFF